MSIAIPYGATEKMVYAEDPGTVTFTPEYRGKTTTAELAIALEPALWSIDIEICERR